jgi:excinuclease ABC subunit A
MTKTAASDAPLLAKKNQSSPDAKSSKSPGGSGAKKRSASSEASNGHGTKPSADNERAIQIVKARSNNLKGVSVTIPRGKLTVATGVSGSGKSSLVFDTLFAEGRRRFAQSLSTYARQFLDKLGRPDVEAIHNLQPAIALEQRNHVKNARSTVGTASEVHDYLRLLFARASDVICPSCGVEVIERTPQSLARELAEKHQGSRLVLAAPTRLTDPKLVPSLRTSLRQMGFSRIWVNGVAAELDDISAEMLENLPTWPVILDRVAVRDDQATVSRLAAAAETAFRMSRGTLQVYEVPADGPPSEPRAYAAGLRCEECGRSFAKPEPELFSFYSPLGACKTCEGYGRIAGIDWGKVIPDPSLSLAKGAVVVWSTPAYQELFDQAMAYCRRASIPTTKPWRDLTPEQQRVIKEGTGDFHGVRGFFDYLGEQRHKVQARVMIARYRSFETCPDCGGARLSAEASAFRIGGKTVADLCRLSIGDLRSWWDALELDDESKAQAAKRLLVELRSRLRYLDDVGLGYLTLDRQTRTLSGGESQRINLASALGSALTDTLYALDEPTVGLHARDTHRLLGILLGLRDNGNTVVVVEHDKEVIKGADWSLDIGPKAGELGGELIFQGTIADLEKHPTSLTGEYLRREKSTRPRGTGEVRKPKGWIGVRGAREHNLKDINVDIPIGVLCCLTGVSGSGKSTLARDILHAGWARLAQQSTEPVGAHDSLQNWKAIEEMTFVDQTPLGRSARSNPVTYTGAWTEIRQMLASTHEARRLSVEARDFSFNVKGGRCEVCEGAGQVTIDLHFLGEVEVECDACGGKRFKDHILAIKHRGKNVDDILSMTVSEALDFFAQYVKCADALRPLADAGLGYLRLGQSTATLSGGELQRLKLAATLGGKTRGDGKMLVFDEPTTGLHPADLDLLANVFDRLVDAGYSILVIEHNLDLIARADWVIDLGPEAGDGGGEVVFEGAPEGLVKFGRSHTARFLGEITGGTQAKKTSRKK